METNEVQRAVSLALSSAVKGTKRRTKGLLSRAEDAVEGASELADLGSDLSAVFGELGQAGGNDFDDDELTAELEVRACACLCVCAWVWTLLALCTQAMVGADVDAPEEAAVATASAAAARDSPLSGTIEYYPVAPVAPAAPKHHTVAALPIAGVVASEAH